MQKNRSKAARIMGLKGGPRRAEIYGEEAMKAMQSKGGKAVRDKKGGVEYFRELNRRSQIAKKAKKLEALKQKNIADS